MDDSKVSELKHIHRELAQYLTEQNNVIITLRRTVATLQLTLDSDSVPQGGRSALANRYRENLLALGTSGTLQPNLTERLSLEAIDSLAKKLTDW